jgi:hypothetical protein
MRRPWVFSAAMCCALGALTIVARGDTPQASDPDGDIPPGWRFAPPDPGPASALRHRADLSTGERAYVDHAGPPANAEAIHAAYASAMSERAQQAMQDAAALEIGLDSLGTEGVVP